MKKCLILAASNLRKSRGQAIAIIVLIFLSSFMLNIWLMLSMDYRQNFDRYHDRLNSEHVTMIVGNVGEEIQEFLTTTIENDNRTDEYNLDDVMTMVGVFDYNGGEINTNLVFIEKQNALSRSVGKVEIVEQGDIKSGVYIPMLYKSKDISIGKDITIIIGNKKFTCTVCGFINSVMLGSHNCSICEMVLTEDKYNELKKLGYATESKICSIRLNDKNQSEKYETMISRAVSQEYPATLTLSNSYALVSQSRYISQMICSGIMSAMAFFILLIALAVIGSNIINYIQESMKNLGVLKAVGYTSSQLIASLMLQFGGISLIVSLIGVGCSYGLFPSVNSMMMSQTGIPYKVHFLPLPMLITIIILVGASLLVVWLSAHRIKKIEPIVALRQGVLTHNFKRNHVPLDKTGIPLNIALALKVTFSSIRNNIIVCIIVFVLSLVVVFSGLMTENVITDMTSFINFIMGETADSCININVDSEEEFLSKMSSDSQVEKVYLFHSESVSHVDGIELMATVCNDFSKLTSQSMIVEGRFPKYDNEIAISVKYAREKHLKIGDEISITAEGKEEKYIISGYTQITNNLGKDCLLTREGYERLGQLQNTSYYLKLKDVSKTDAFNSEVKELFGDEVNLVINIDAAIQAAASVYVTLMTIIVIAVIMLSIVIVTFVLYLLAKTMQNNKRRDYGVMKALGFTTRQLILQTAISFMPAVTVSMVLGLIINSFIINPLTALFLKDIGIVKCTFTVPVGLISVAGFAMIILTFLIACWMSLKIKKISPRELMAGE